MKLWFLLPVAATLSALFTGALRRYALDRNILDIPNDRSSHTVPTPRGGGLAIVVTFLAIVFVLASLGAIELSVSVSILGAGVIVALIGFIDDHRAVSAHWRLLVHLLAAMWALVWLGGLPPLSVGTNTVDLGWIGHVLAIVCLVWLLNLYNFMDGIDGIAAIEAVTIGFGAAVLYLLNPASQQEWLLPACLAMAAVGFLIWNWPPAKIFMGDTGSGFLGLMLGLMSIRATRLTPEFLWCWVILLGVFVVDATGTLLRRTLRGEKPHEAHHNHAYQTAARLVGAHRPVTLAVGAINLGWLLPIALAVERGWVPGVVGVLVAYAPLACLGLVFRAGAPSP